MRLFWDRFIFRRWYYFLNACNGYLFFRRLIFASYTFSYFILCSVLARDNFFIHYNFFFNEFTYHNLMRPARLGRLLLFFIFGHLVAYLLYFEHFVLPFALHWILGVDMKWNVHLVSFLNDLSLRVLKHFLVPVVLHLNLIFGLSFVSSVAVFIYIINNLINLFLLLKLLLLKIKRIATINYFQFIFMQIRSSLFNV